ncbi:MAG: N-acetylneuraminate synthase family protein [Bacteroidota bacterium]
MSNWAGKHGPLLIAEIGGNHEGNFEYAKELTQLAIDSNVDYIKFQIYTGDSLVNPIEGPVRNKHFKKFELSPEQHQDLAKMCHDAGIGYMASVWDMTSFPWIDDYMNIYKIGSGDLTAYPLLRAIAKLGKPMIISSGVAYLKEVEEAIEFIRSENKIYQDRDNLAVLQCTSMYPIPFSDANLNVMHSFQKEFDVAIGYSDHTEGSYALEIATAMGAEVLEFHFTDSREGKEFRDHKVSLTRDEVIALSDRLKNIRSLQGNSLKSPLEVEGDHRTTFRRALYPKSDIAKNTIITEDHLIALRPNHGIDAKDYIKLLGKRTNRALTKHQRLEWNFFDGNN